MLNEHPGMACVRVDMHVIKSLKYPQSPRKRLTAEMLVGVGIDKIASTPVLISVQPSWVTRCPSISISLAKNTHLEGFSCMPTLTSL